MKQKLLICEVGGGAEHALPLIKRMGYDLIILANRDLRQDEKDLQVTMDISDIDKVMKKAAPLFRKENIAGIIPLGRNIGVKPAAKLSTKYGLPGISPATALACTDKSIQYSLFKESNVPIPKTKTCSSKRDVLELGKKWKYPLVIKPKDLAGSKGVRKIRSPKEINQSIKYALANETKSKEFLIQECLKGSEHSIEAVVHKGKIFVTGFSDRIYEYKDYDPFFVERGDILPTTLKNSSYKKLENSFKKAVKCVRIENGIAKADLILSHDKPFLIELHARMGTPNFWELNQLSTGINTLGAIVNVAVGKSPKKHVRPLHKSKGVIFDCLLPKEGTFVKLEGLKEAKKIPGFYKFSWWNNPLKKGDKIKPIKNLVGMIAYIVAVNKNRELAIQTKNKILKHLKIVTKK